MINPVSRMQILVEYEVSYIQEGVDCRASIPIPLKGTLANCLAPLAFWARRAHVSIYGYFVL